jgi:hypothetical protein
VTEEQRSDATQIREIATEGNLFGALEPAFTEAFTMRTARPVTRSSLSGLVLLALSAGCVIQEQDERIGIAEALPTAEQVKIRLPESELESYALGQIADYYLLTRGVTVSLNLGAAWVLGVVHAIVQHPATAIDGDVYTWGPWEGSGLDPARYRLVVTANPDGTFDWSLDGQSKGSPEDGFLTVISGHAVPDDDPGVAPHRGHGSFHIDFDAGERVNPIDNRPDTGSVLVDYDLASRTVTMHSEGVDELGNPGAFDYAYAENLDGSGDFQFALDADLDQSGAAHEQALIRSRWLSDGQGRSDAMLSGGDLGEFSATATECWDSRFRRVHYSDSVESQPSEGNASECAFADMALPEFGE